MTTLNQLWIAGILVAFSVFGIKVGLGLSAQIYSLTISVGKKAMFMAGTLFTYIVLFAGLFYLITHFSLLNYLDQFMNVLRYGMLIHLSVAIGLLLWGVKLLIQDPARQRKYPYQAGLLLILPCPVCATVILLNLCLAYSFLTLSPPLITLILLGFFSGIIIVTLGLIFPFRHKIGSASSFLGLAMTLVSLYFLITVIIAPIYPEIKAAFAMASSNSPVNQMDSYKTSILVLLLFILGGTGFIKNYFSRGGAN